MKLHFDLYLYVCGPPLQDNVNRRTESDCAAVMRALFIQVLDWIDVRLYSAILRSLEQTHCARMWFYMSD